MISLPRFVLSRPLLCRSAPFRCGLPPFHSVPAPFRSVPLRYDPPSSPPPVALLSSSLRPVQRVGHAKPRHSASPHRVALRGCAPFRPFPRRPPLCCAFVFLSRAPQRAQYIIICDPPPRVPNMSIVTEPTSLLALAQAPTPRSSLPWVVYTFRVRGVTAVLLHASGLSLLSVSRVFLSAHTLLKTGTIRPKFWKHVEQARP